MKFYVLAPRIHGTPTISIQRKIFYFGSRLVRVPALLIELTVLDIRVVVMVVREVDNASLHDTFDTTLIM